MLELNVLCLKRAKSITVTGASVWLAIVRKNVGRSHLRTSVYAVSVLLNHVIAH